MSSPSRVYPNCPRDWYYNVITNDFTHAPTGVIITEEMVYDYGFPDPQYCRSAIAIRQWYFAKMTNARIAGQAPPGPMPNFSWSPKAPAQPQVFYQQAQQQLRQKIQQLSNWWEEQVEKEPIELLLCVESFIVRIPKYQISVVSLEWLHCRTSKDSVWLSCSLVKSPVPISLWEKDFIVIQITPPGLDPINEVACGCKLKIVGPIVLGEAPQVRLEDLAIRDVPFFSISEMR